MNIKYTTNEKITMLEAQVVTLQMQARSILNSLTVMAETIDRLAHVIGDQDRKLEAVDEAFARIMVHQDALAAMSSDEPDPDDVWQIDQWKLGEELLYRVEDHS